MDLRQKQIFNSLLTFFYESHYKNVCKILDRWSIAINIFYIILKYLKIIQEIMIRSATITIYSLKMNNCVLKNNIYQNFQDIYYKINTTYT